MEKYSEIKNYYDIRYSESREKTFPADEARYRAWFGPLLENKIANAKLLDVGCGAGHVCSFFSELGYTVAGVDISGEAIAFARQRRAAGNF